MVAKKITHLHGHLLIADSRDHSVEVAKNDDKKWNDASMHGRIEAQGGSLCPVCWYALAHACLVQTGRVS